MSLDTKKPAVPAEGSTDKVMSELTTPPSQRVPRPAQGDDVRKQKQKERRELRRRERIAAASKEKSTQPASPSTAAPVVEATKTPSPVHIQQHRTPKKKRGLAIVSFLLLVIVPSVLVGFYYNVIASDQYQSETRFAVRGTDTSPLLDLGLTALPGNSAQSSDAYVVTEYINSLQLITDLKERENVDLRKFFATDSIDPLYRIEPNMPLEEFVSYWEWMTDADYNSTTSITTFRVNAFSGPDAGLVSAAVLKAAARLVNTLSTEARNQLISTAETEVSRTEARLVAARESVTKFRNKEQSLDPKLQAQSDQELIQGLQKEIIALQARRAALLSTVNSRSPSVRVIDRQVGALNIELQKQLQTIGSGTEKGSDINTRSLQLSEYSRLVLEEEFAVKAYTTALASLETSRAEARKQERYFAIVVEPTIPQVALYPYRIINTLIGFGLFLVGWLIIYLVVQSVRDHAV